MIDWFFATLQQYPEIAIFLALAEPEAQGLSNAEN